MCIRDSSPTPTRPSGPSRTTRRPGSGMRPSGPSKPAATEPQSPVRKTRRTTPSSNEPNQPVRKTRKTSKSPQSEVTQPPRKSRRTVSEPKKSRKRRSSTSFDDLFGVDEKSDFDSAVTAAKERRIVGDSEQSVLARLQSEGWNVKQSKFILGHAKS